MESLVAVSGFVLTLVVQALLAPIARRLGLLDHPTARKNHFGPTPITGGIAMWTGVLATGAAMFGTVGPGWRGFSTASVVLIVVGLIDDKCDLSWRLRVPAQVLAALCMIFLGGAYVEQLGSLFGFGMLSLGWLAIPFTVLATVGITNAINMVDGADGLAGMLVLSTLVMFEATAMYTGDHVDATRILVVIGAVAAFLAYNLRLPGRPRAKAFMGNAGSGFLGLVIAWFAIRLTQQASHPVGPVLMLWLVPVPLMDCLVLMLHRMRIKRSPFAADHNHIHHLMQDGGFGPTQAAIALSLFSGLCGLLAGLAMLAHVSHFLLLVAFVALCATWYWMTAKRSRAVHFFRWVHNGTLARLDTTASRLSGGASMRNSPD
jgi:UDP-GlcNAc:undecaprenyl-phosphate GlcNAc-1-phosphate transferase